jgi:hypothetical protein
MTPEKSEQPFLILSKNFVYCTAYNWLAIDKDNNNLNFQGIVDKVKFN